MAEHRLAVVALAVAGCWGIAQPALAATPGERAAAFPDLAHTQVHDAPWFAALLVERLEWQQHSGDDALLWDATGWIGSDSSRLWLRSEGERTSGAAGEGTLEAFWGRPVAAWWDLLAGVRRDFGPGASRSYLALGVQGLAPQWFHVEATAYAGEGGQVGAGLEVQYDWLLTQRLILGARGEALGWSDDDTPAGIGAGLASGSLGLRLRYEIRREFAPYVGIDWQGRFGDTADLARAAGERRRETSAVAGVRFWF